MSEKFNKDYYESGIETGSSCYQNYRWMPERTIRFCMAIIEYLKITRRQKILDFGCGKGFMIKAFKILLRQAFGVETSKYCLANLDPDVRNVVWSVIPNMHFDWIISKDTFEHIPYNELPKILRKLAKISDNMFCIIPLASAGEYRIPSYEMDKTHIVRENEMWWTHLFEENGWYVIRFEYSIKGMKENWTKDYPFGNGFWVLSTKKPSKKKEETEAWRISKEELGESQ